MKALIERLEREHILPREEFAALLRGAGEQERALLARKARAVSLRHFGPNVYIRGLIEFSNYCRRDCLYCGIRRGNRAAERYRLFPEEILACCKLGHALGFRTFVLQGGEDPGFPDALLSRVVWEIKRRWPDCAVTLSAGERDEQTYLDWRKAGADRYLLRHETADEAHFARLHPPGQTLSRRKECLWTLKRLGFQTGAGFMVGSPFQTPENLADDLLFLWELRPQMVGIGPFIPHRDTPFAGDPAGTLEQTLLLLSILRLMLPDVLLPATTALGTIAPDGRERGILAGANVVMPNLSPDEARRKYTLYDNQLCTGGESAEGLALLRERLAKIGYSIPVSRGDAGGR